MNVKLAKHLYVDSIGYNKAQAKGVTLVYKGPSLTGGSLFKVKDLNNPNVQEWTLPKTDLRVLNKQLPRWDVNIELTVPKAVKLLKRYGVYYATAKDIEHIELITRGWLIHVSDDSMMYTGFLKIKVKGLSHGR